MRHGCPTPVPLLPHRGPARFVLPRTSARPADAAPRRPRPELHTPAHVLLPSSRLRHAALVVLAMGSVSACSRPVESALGDEVLARLPLRERVAQLVLARVRVPEPGDTAAHARLREWAREGVGGVLLVGGGAREARALLDSLRDAAPLPLLAAVDADRGLGATLAGGTELPPAIAVGFAAGAEAAGEMGEAAAAELRAMGIDLALVTGPPVAPAASLVPADSRAASAQAGVAAYAAALRGAGLDVLVRAFPAGAADGAVPRFRWDRAALEAVGLAWLRGMVADEIDAVALAPVVLPSLTGDTLPLPVSPAAVAGLLRRDLGFRGAIALELGPASPLVARHGEAEAAIRAVAAGTDLLVGVEDPATVIDALVGAVRAGRIPAARVEAAVGRVFALKRRVEPAPVDGDASDRAPSPPPPLPHPETVAAARRAHALAALRLGDPAAALRGCPSVAVVAARGAGASLLARAVASGRPGTTLLVADTVALRGPVVRDTAAFRGAPACLLLEHRGGLAPTVVDRLVADSAAAAGDTAAARVAAAVPPRRVVEVGFLSNRVVSPRPAAAVLAWGLGEAARQAAAGALLGTAEAPESAPRIAFPPARELREVPAESVGMSSAALARVDEAVRAALADGLAPGAAVAIGRRGGIVRLRGYGRTAPGGPPVDAATLYDIASLTKVVGTTAAIMSLVEEGRVELDAPVRDYLPEFRGPGKGAVKVSHLLTHTSGLPAGAWLYNSASAAPALDRVMRARLVYPTGSRAVYSDFGMILLAELVARQAEEPLDTYLARRVFAPLGMQSTMYRPPAWLHPRTAPAAVRSERPYPVRGVVHDANAFRLDGVTGHAGLFSTAEDVAVLAQTLLNGGAYGPRRLWAPATVRQFTMHRARAGERGLGWDHPAPRSSAGDYLAASSYGHTGFTGTSVWIDPVRDLFVVVLTNRTYDNASQGAMLALRQKVADAAALALTDVGTVTPRAGTATAVEQARQRRVEEQRRQRERQRPRRPTRPRNRRRG